VPSIRKAPKPLFDSNDDWSAATRRLIEYRRLGDDEDDDIRLLDQ
jgi:hypothetical protein